VIGEEPYAEWFGDIQQLEYQLGDKRDLALIKKLKQQGIPVVTVFLTGRPLWTNKEINASDAFVVAWLPGSEGQGVADLLLSDAEGKTSYDFQGKLSFSWPKYDHQFVLNKGDANYDPLFAYGYGLSYAEHKELGQFSEQVSVVAASSSDDGIQPLFVRNLASDMAWVLTDSSVAGSEDSALITTPYGVSTDGNSLAMQSVNLSYQEDGRQLRWNSTAQASASLRYLKSLAASDFSKAKALRLSLRLDQQAPAELNLGVLCDQQAVCQRNLSLTKALAQLKPGVWHSVEVALDCADTSAVKQVSDALVLSSSGQHSLAVAEMVLTAQQSTAAATGTVVVGCAN